MTIMSFAHPKPETTVEKALSRLTEYLEQHDDEIDCFQAALLIAMGHYPKIDIGIYQKQIKSMVRAIRPYMHLAHTPAQQIATLNASLFDEMGFSGNREEYQDPCNSFIHEVMERRKGIPITLSLLYFTLALRLDIPIFPVGMPYHFLVKYEGEHEEFYIDPFYGGIILTEEECYARMNQAAGHTVAYDSAYLRITPKRILLYRLLNNLKQIYFTAENWRSAEIVLKQLLIILPESYPNLRDLGKIALREHRYPDAIQWLQQYLDAEPNAPDAAQVLETMVHAHRQHLGRN